MEPVGLADKTQGEIVIAGNPVLRIKTRAPDRLSAIQYGLMMRDHAAHQRVQILRLLDMAVLARIGKEEIGIKPVADALLHVAQHVHIRKAIAAVEKPHILARGAGQTFVHRVIYAGIRLGHKNRIHLGELHHDVRCIVA